jgi:hypothetical protein
MVFTFKVRVSMSDTLARNLAHLAQHDAHFAAGALGLPVPRRSSTPDNPVIILCIQWLNVVKPTGKRKCRACIDGSRCAAPCSDVCIMY